MANQISGIARRTLLAYAVGAGVALAAGPVRAEGVALAGRWEGVADLPGDRMAFGVTFASAGGGGIAGAVDIPDSGVMALPLSDVAAEGATVRFAMPFGGAAIPFVGRLDGDRLTGELTLGGANAPFALRRRPEVVPPYATHAVTIAHGDVRLAGTLLVPRGRGPHPAMVFQQSGHPESRQPWLYWADHFARNGIAGLIWDNHGADRPREAPWTDFAEVAQDGLAARALLRTRHDIDSRRIGLFAVSQGGWIAPMVAARDPTVAWIAMVSGPGIPMAQCVLYEARRELEGAGLPAAEVTAGVAAKARFERMILDGADDDALDSFRAMVRRERWFPMIGLMPRGHWHRGWWRRNGGNDPAPYWARVRAPVLDLYGSRDVEVPVDDSIAAMARAYRGGAGRLATHVFDADHSLRTRRGPRPVRTPEVMETMTAWVRSRAADDDRR